MTTQMNGYFFIAMVLLGVTFAQGQQGPAMAPSSDADIPSVSPSASPPSFTVPTVAPVVAPIVAPIVAPVSPVTTPIVAPISSPPTALPTTAPSTTPVSSPDSTPASSPSVIAPGPASEEGAAATTSPVVWTGFVVASALVAALAY